MTEYPSSSPGARLIESGAAPAAVPAWVHQLVAMLVFGGLVVFGFVLPIAGITTWVERRVMGAHPEPHRAEPRRAASASSSGSPTASRTC